MTSPAATADDVAPDDLAGDEPPRGVIPQDSFATRLAIVRAGLRCNYDQLSRTCTELGERVHSEQFRRWEHRAAECSKPERVARVLARIPIPGSEGLPDGPRFYDFRWILHGGPMRAERLAERPGPEQPVLTHWRDALDEPSRSPRRVA